MPFSMPTGLLNAASGTGPQMHGLPTGLTGGLFQSLGQTDIAAQIRQNVMSDLSEIEKFKYGIDWKNPNSNAIEQLLNNDKLPQPWYEIEGRLSLGPDGLIEEPAGNKYGQLYDFESINPLYSVYSGGERTGQITGEEAALLPGYKSGESFTSPNDDRFIYRPEFSGWNPSDQGYVQNEDPYSKYVDNWVVGAVPNEVGNNVDKHSTQAVSAVFNPIMQTYIDQINNRLTPEQIQAAIDAGVDPLEFSYKIHDWNIQNHLFGTDASGLGSKPISLMNDLDAWTQQIFEAAGTNRPATNRYQLPTGLTGY